MRFFEKISYEQFKKDVKDDVNLYNSYHIPVRETKFAAGYDFEAIEQFILKPNEVKKIPTGIKVNMNDGEVLLLFVRSSMGFKYNVRLCNQVGVIDKDYYNNVDNEGHFFVKLQNEGMKDYFVHKGDKICQGIFIKYLLTEEQENFVERRSDY